MNLLKVIPITYEYTNLSIAFESGSTYLPSTRAIFDRHLLKFESEFNIWIYRSYKLDVLRWCAENAKMAVVVNTSHTSSYIHSVDWPHFVFMTLFMYRAQNPWGKFCLWHWCLKESLSGVHISVRTQNKEKESYHADTGQPSSVDHVYIFIQLVIPIVCFWDGELWSAGMFPFFK